MQSGEVSLIRCGRGKELVFLHGYLSSKESFAYQIEYLSKFFSVTAFDFWGFGKSPSLKEAWSVGDYAEATLSLLQSLKIERCNVLAHSFGGRVALKLLANSPRLFDKALLTGCAGVLPKRGVSYRLRVKAYRAVKRIAPSFAEKKFGSAEYKTLSPVMRESYKKIVNEDLTPLLCRIKTPVLYVFGEKDTATPPYMAEILRQNTPNSELLYMKGCTHFCFCEQPQLFNAIAREFFMA